MLGLIIIPEIARKLFNLRSIYQILTFNFIKVMIPQLIFTPVCVWATFCNTVDKDVCLHAELHYFHFSL